jgi:SAM-dependent methyltransferase
VSSPLVVETPHFRVAAGLVRPRFPHARVDNSLGDHIAAELVPLGLVPDVQAFERIFVSTVVGSAATPAAAWTAFYRNTLRRLNRAEPHGVDTVSTFARIYAHLIPLIRGASVLDVGCCFGFLPMLLSEREPGTAVVGCDLVPATVALAHSVARARRNRAVFIAGDAHRLPAGGAAVDTVTAVHLLEHLPRDSTATVLAELCRVARNRVVVAVPLEDVPDPTYGHARVFDLPALADLGEATGWPWSVEEYEGGWLVLDRPPTTCPVG